MDIKTESKITITTSGFLENGVLKTHDCDLGDWYGNEICREIDFNKEIKNICTLEGEYNIKIILEKTKRKS